MALAGVLGLCSHGGSRVAADPLVDGFRSPPASARPRTWWHWMNGNVTRAGVDLDLAWMKRVGLGGLQQFDVALDTPTVVADRLAYMTPPWIEVFRHAAAQADHLGLEMAIASSPGWSESGGPWVTPPQAMKKLVWSETRVQGGRPFDAPLPLPPTLTGPFQSTSALQGGLFGHHGPQPLPSFYADVAVLALPAAATMTPRPRADSSAGPLDAATLLDGDLTQKIVLPLPPDRAAWVSYDFGSPQTFRSVSIATGAVPVFSAGGVLATLEASDDGVHFAPVADLPNGSAAQQTTQFAPVTARYFRLSLRTPAATRPALLDSAAPGADFAALASLMPTGATAPPHVDLSEFRLSPEATLNQFELKAAFGLVADYYALQAHDLPVSGVDPHDVIDLTHNLTPDGRLIWTPPPGQWRVLRLGYSLIGIENHPATAESTGLEVDKLSEPDVAAYIGAYLDRYARLLGPGLLGAHGVRAMVNDSTEVGPQNWTDDLIAQFERRRGYDPRPWLPALTGIVIGDTTKSNAFLYDFRSTLAELTALHHYAVIAAAAHARGLITYGEALENGRPSLGDDLEMRRYTSIPMAAMWSFKRTQGPRPSFVADIRGAAAVAHVYGQNLVAAESMTSALAPWNFAPADLKSTIDLEFALGVNLPVVHTSVHQPLIGHEPGLTLSIFGQYFNRNDTWAEHARPWIDYLVRNAFLLQQGRFFADVAYFYGEEAPLTGLYGAHDPNDLPHGHAVDFVNAPMLDQQFSVDHGELVARSGARYRLLYLGGSSEHMTLGTLRRIGALLRAGAVVAGLRPRGSPSLADDPLAFEREADALWGGGDGPRRVGQGTLIPAASPDAALQALNLAADFRAVNAAPDAEVMFVHRRLPDGDLYYLDNRRPRTQHFDAQFRISGRLPELWHADTGSREAVSFRTDGAITTIPLTLQPDEAVYVVFRQATSRSAATRPTPAETPVLTLDGPWTIAFEAGRGAPAHTRIDRLSSWTESTDPGIKYFSGAATYTRNLELPADALATPGRWVLDLGEVRDLAEVTLNGKPVGAPWHAPYRVDLGGVLRPGTNRLQVTIVNTWVNRLIGDRQPGMTPVTFTALPTYLAGAPLRPGGLLGPVRLLRIGPSR